MITTNKEEYYSNVEVLFEMVKVAKDREVAFLGDAAIRHIKAHAVRFLKKNFKGFNFFKKDFNIFYSLAHYWDMPMFSFNPTQRIEQQKGFAGSLHLYFRGLDLGIDFDNNCIYRNKMFCIKHKKDTTTKDCNKCKEYESDWNTVCKDVSAVKRYLDEFTLPYQLKFSGNGFHINIDNKYFELFDGYQLIGFGSKLYSEIVDEIIDVCNCKTIDTCVYEERRVWKMPYSYDILTGNVALPLTNKQFKNFNLDMVKPENVLSGTGIRNRGLLERPGDSTNVKKFIQEVI